MKTILSIIILLGLTSCGPKGLEPCTDRHEVKEILTGVKQGCSGSAGIVVGAITQERAETLLDGTFTADVPFEDEDVKISTVVALKERKFFSIHVLEFNGETIVIAFKGDLLPNHYEHITPDNTTGFYLGPVGPDTHYTKTLPNIKTQELILSKIEIYHDREEAMARVQELQI